MLRIAVIVGSLRKESINLKFARALAKLKDDRLDFIFADLHDMPVYNEDLWQHPPQSVLNLKKAIELADGVLFVTPEYNRSVPPVIKNVLDWVSRPNGSNSWKDKPAGIVGASQGSSGAATAQSHLRSIVPILEMPLLGSPEVYLTFKPEFFDDEHNVTDEKTRAFLEKYLTVFADWVEKYKK